MKKAGIIAGVIILIIIVIAVATCDGILPGESQFEIRVSGTGGLAFSGNYLVAGVDGDSASKSVDGTIPEQYSVTGAIVSAVFQKQAEDGTLRVEIIKAGEVVATSETTAAYGVVSVGTMG